MTPLFGPYLPSLVFALAYVGFWWQVVRWMDRPPMHLSPAALSGAVAGAFVLGLAAAVGLMALTSRFTVGQVHNRTSRRLR